MTPPTPIVVDANTQTDHRTNEKANSALECWSAALQVEPHDDKCPCSLRNVETVIYADFSTQITTSTNKMHTQTDGTPQLTPQPLVIHPEPPAAAMSWLAMSKDLADLLPD
jgi:hypothetical protein